MSAYRFCRTDDIGLLVEALNRCWSPYVPDQEPVTAAAFKRSIRDLQVWCSSCMVAFSGSDVIGVLIGAKRAASTLVHRIAVHPDHLRQGHGSHLLASLSSKLAILGPPRIVAELPEALAPARHLFSASGYVQEARLVDYVLRFDAHGAADSDRHRPMSPPSDGIVIPVTVDDLAANSLLGDAPPPSASDRRTDRQVCWKRSVETLTARKDDIAGLGVVSDERIEAYVLYARSELEGRRSASGAELGERGTETEILALRSFVDDGGARFEKILLLLRAQGLTSLRLARVHPCEVPIEWLQRLGFRPAGAHALYAVTPVA